jgi:hypothetical protein
VTERKSMKIAVTADAKRVVESIAHRDEMSEQAVASRIYQWFTEQPGVLQRLILGHIDNDMRQEAMVKIVAYFQQQARAPGGIKGTERKVMGTVEGGGKI